VTERQSLVKPLLELCREAGDLICQHYGAPGAGEYRAKGDDSPLTQADIASHRLLQSGLAAMQPSLPILSEESSAQERVGRRSWSRYWLVDPLDGTKEFLSRTGEFTINIALIEQHSPVLGVLYLPLEKTAYVGIPGESAVLYRCIADQRWQGEPLAARKLEARRPLVVLASRRHRGARLQLCLSWLQENWGEFARENSGSALKFCQLASGQGDFYPRYARCCEWDTAAGQAVVEAAGGRVLGLDGQPLRYNLGESLYSKPFFAVADPEHPLWRAWFVHLERTEAD
jgi:3'(2'), 5'-bisphosphate nucleotidase